jgi:hypothetical protein
MQSVIGNQAVAPSEACSQTEKSSIMARKPQTDPAFITCKHCGKDFRGINAIHLYAKHGYTGEHPVNDYKARFGLQHAECADSRKKIGVAKDQFWARRGQHWTPKSLIAEIRRRWRTGQTMRYSQVPDRIWLAARRLFGSWQKAVEKAGLNYETATGFRRWTQAKVIEEIHKLAAKNVPLYPAYIKKHHPKLHKAALWQFPTSWKKALRAAGLNPKEIQMARTPWDKAKAKAWVRKRYATKKSLASKDIPTDLKNFVKLHMGKCWTDFVESLGIAYPGRKLRRD